MTLFSDSSTSRQLFLVNLIKRFWSHNWLMLMRLAFKPSISHTLVNLGKPRTYRLPLLRTLAETSSQKVTRCVRSQCWTSSKKLISSIMCLEHPLSKYHDCSVLALREVNAKLHLSSDFFTHYFISGLCGRNLYWLALLKSVKSWKYCGLIWPHLLL